MHGDVGAAAGERVLGPGNVSQQFVADPPARIGNVIQQPGHALHPVIDAVNDTTGGERTFTFAGGVTIVVDKDNLRVQKSA